MGFSVLYIIAVLASIATLVYIREDYLRTKDKVRELENELEKQVYRFQMFKKDMEPILIQYRASKMWEVVNGSND